VPADLVMGVLIGVLVLAAALQWRRTSSLRRRLVATGAAAADRATVEATLQELRSTLDALTLRIDQLEGLSREAESFRHEIQERVHAQASSTDEARARTQDVAERLDQHVNEVGDRLSAFMGSCDALIRAEIAAQVAELNDPVVFSSEAEEPGDSASHQTR
jgi:chromosome segregation ATPase